MLTVTSRTIMAGERRVNVRAVNPQRPTGLATIGWTWPGYDINVTVDGVKYLRVGSLMVRPSGNFALSIGEEKGLWDCLNTLNQFDCARHGLTRTFSYKTADFALDHLTDYIRCQLTGEKFVP